MALYLSIVILIVGIVGLVLDYNSKTISEIREAVLFGLTVCGGLATIVLGFVVMANALDFKTNEPALTQRYDVLVYQYEEKMYSDEKAQRDLIADIQEWNQDVISHQARNKNIWIGNLVPNGWDELEIIDIKDAHNARK